MPPSTASSRPPCVPPDRRPALPGSGAATRYAEALLTSLGWGPERAGARPADPSPERAWADSGAMALTGRAGGPPCPAPAPVASCADGAARALQALGHATTGRAPHLDGAALLGERAALSRPVLTRAGTRAPGGGCRLIRCADGWLALNLARPDDVSLLPAWLEVELPALGDPFDAVARACADRRSEPLVARGRGMGLAVSPARRAPERPPRAWQTTRVLGVPRPPRDRRPLVIDLSSLWAGPLCAQLLGACGARVVKVESRERPDGARRGGPGFFDRMNGEKESVQLPFSEASGRRDLAALLARADLVVAASRPRAFAQLGIDVEALVAAHATTWIQITGHGATGEWADWVAFGDDAAAAAGLLVWHDDGEPGFCGDAIADPLTGLHAALAGLSAWAQGGARRVDLSLADVASWVRLQPGPEPTPTPAADPRPPRARAAAGRARPLGADTRRVLGELPGRAADPLDPTQ